MGEARSDTSALLTPRDPAAGAGHARFVSNVYVELHVSCAQVDSEDLSLALELQRHEEAQLVGGIPEDQSDASVQAFSGLSEPETVDDAALAAILQAEFDAEHDRQVSVRERLANLSGGKVCDAAFDCEL